jgi:ABC-type dipeptide/oligopeptide/nickel transport system permease subunit
VKLPKIARTAGGQVGLLLLLAVLLLAFIGPFLAPHDVDETIGPPHRGPSAIAPLGTDLLGRDVLSRLLEGGASVILLGIAATLLSYVAGLAVGLTAGYSRSWLDPVMMRSVDVLLAFPALLVLVVLVAGLGNGLPILLLGVVLIQLPGIARLVRTATQEVSVRGYVESAVARGERTPAILLREIVPNISPVLLADVGLRFGYSILLIASVNYLGFGLQPPSSDWGLTISLNQAIIRLNPWSVLAPAIALAALTVSVNLIGDAYTSALDTTAATRRRRRWVRQRASTLAPMNP